MSLSQSLTWMGVVWPVQEVKSLVDRHPSTAWFTCVGTPRTLITGPKAVLTVGLMLMCYPITNAWKRGTVMATAAIQSGAVKMGQCMLPGGHVRTPCLRPLSMRESKQAMRRRRIIMVRNKRALARWSRLFIRGVVGPLPMHTCALR